jgi:beta-dihydromenaquinone-9 omega-hydroxylase
MSGSTDVIFDPWSPEVQADPYPYYAELRKHTPVVRIPATDRWVVTRYADVRTATMDHTRFSVKQGLGVRDQVAGNVLVQRDPPTHTKSRRALQPLFAPKVLGAWQERAQVIADALVDEMLASGGRVEFKRAVAMPLAVQMTTEMMGLPDTDDVRPKYFGWSQRVMEDLDRREGDPDIADLYATLEEAITWFDELITARRAEARETPRDLIDGIMLTDTNGHTPYEITEIAMTVLAAGLANTVEMMCHGVHALARNPHQFALLRTDPAGRAVPTVEEAVRFGSPAHCVYRLTLDDVEIAETTIPKDNKVMILWGSANHDETVFPDPERFDILRDNHGRHIGWGAGVHRCIGEHIARLEGVACFRALAKKVGDLQLDGAPELYSTSAVRGFQTLPVIVAAA